MLCNKCLCGEFTKIEDDFFVQVQSLRKQKLFFYRLSIRKQWFNYSTGFDCGHKGFPGLVYDQKYEKIPLIMSQPDEVSNDTLLMNS